MSDLTLKHLLRLEEPNVDNLRIKSTRHVMKGRGWDGFDDLIRFDDDLLSVFSGNMTDDKYKDTDIVLNFVALPKSKALFRGAFINHGRISFNKAKIIILVIALITATLNLLPMFITAEKNIKNHLH